MSSENWKKKRRDEYKYIFNSPWKHFTSFLSSFFKRFLFYPLVIAIICLLALINFPALVVIFAVFWAADKYLK
jgi:hypothetical protein